MDILRIVLAIILPPLGVFLQVGLTKHFWLNILLTILGYPKFFVIEIQRQLACSEALIGYSLDANVPGKEVWTLSVWEDRESLGRFVQRIPHSRAASSSISGSGSPIEARSGRS